MHRADAILAAYGVNEARAVTATTDPRALSIAYYRDGQRAIVKEVLADLQDLISRSISEGDGGEDAESG